MEFETGVYVDEYVIDGANSGVFAGDDTRITYTPDHGESGVSFVIPTDEIATITFDRDTSLLRNRLLGWFFAGITLVLILALYLSSFAGRPTSPDVSFLSIFLGFLIIGGISTTYEYVTGESYDVVVLSIRTDDDELYTVCGRRGNPAFVAACNELIESDIETRDRSGKLE